MNTFFLSIAPWPPLPSLPENLQPKTKDDLAAYVRAALTRYRAGAETIWTDNDAVKADLWLRYYAPGV
jgi:hypothetical protein